MSTDLDTLDILPSKPLVNGPHCGGCPNQCEGIRYLPADRVLRADVVSVGRGWPEGRHEPYVLQSQVLSRKTLCRKTGHPHFPRTRDLRPRTVCRPFLGPFLSFPPRLGWGLLSDLFRAPRALTMLRSVSIALACLAIACQAFCAEEAFDVVIYTATAGGPRRRHRGAPRASPPNATRACSAPCSTRSSPPLSWPTAASLCCATRRTSTPPRPASSPPASMSRSRRTSLLLAVVGQGPPSRPRQGRQGTRTGDRDLPGCVSKARRSG